MKLFIYGLILLVSFPSYALGDTDVGTIAIFSDAALTSCNITDQAGLLYVYIGHIGMGEGSQGAQFKVGASAGVAMTYIAVSSQYLVIGDANSDLSVIYGGCKTGDLLIATVAYVGTGTTPNCESLQILPSNGIGSGQIEIVTCDNYKQLFSSGGMARINPDGSCACVTEGQQKEVTIRAQPSGLQIAVDGMPRTTPVSYGWAAGGLHNVDARSPQTGSNDSIYVFTRWSNGGDRAHDFVVPDTNITLTAFYQSVEHIDTGFIGLYSDEDALGCYINDDTTGGTVDVYVVHKATENVLSSRFRVRSKAGFGLTYLGETHEIPNSIGSVLTGHQAYYDNCFSSDFLVATIHFATTGTSAPCSYLEVVPDPAASSGNIEVTGCDEIVRAVNSSRLYVNADGGCECGVTPENAVDFAVETIPEDLEIFVDSSPYVSPRYFLWQIGSIHNIGVNYFETGSDDILYVFQYWSDGGAREHTVTVPSVETVTTASFSTAFQSARISAIDDVPSDQGGFVEVMWLPSGYDFDGSPEPIVEYIVYRNIYSSAAAAVSDGSADVTSKPIGPPDEAGVRPEPQLAPDGWQYVTTIPANGSDEYGYVTSSHGDSTIFDGVCYTAFTIRAVTSTPGVYVDSPPDSGYSKDNLPPGVPKNFLVAYNRPGGNELSWDPPEGPEVFYYKVYRTANPDFDFTSPDFVEVTTNTYLVDYTESGYKYLYTVTATDHSGNESAAAPPPGTIVATNNSDIPSDVMLNQNYPNPFNPSTTITFGVPAPGHVELSVYSTDGKLVVTLLSEQIPVGFRSLTWEGMDAKGNVVGSGIYFYRLSVTGRTITKKMVLLK